MRRRQTCFLSRLECLVAILALAFCQYSYAATDILDVDTVNAADEATLMAEADLFRTIGMGIALSVARCQGQGACNPAVNVNELQRLIEALERRIQGMTKRQEDSEADMAKIITAYADEKEKYSGYMQQLAAIPRLNPPVDEYSDLFEDADAELLDDEDLGDDDFDPGDL